MNFNFQPTQTTGEVFRPMVTGDLHVSDRYSGRHVDYFRDCCEHLEQITNEIVSRKITHLFLTGDVIGRTTEKNLKSREALMYFMKVLQHWNELTKGHVYSVRGNHDFSEKLTDFEVFVSLGLIKTPKEVDVGSVRFHLIDYGDHRRELNIEQDSYNVAIMHSTIWVEGATTWFKKTPDAIELSSLENLYGVDFVVGGHIHTPSVRPVSTSIRDRNITLFYPGNGTRPAKEPNLWEKCFGLVFEVTEDGAALQQVEFNLRPVSEIFVSVYDDIELEDELASDESTFDIEQLSAVLEELKNYNLLGESDYKTKIVKLGGIDKEAVDLALHYIEKVEGEMK